MELDHVLSALGLEGAACTPFPHEEDDGDYDVWKVSHAGRECVLKPAKEMELEVYTTFLRDAGPAVPQLYGTARAEGADWLLMEYVPGEDLCRCTREKLIPALDALTDLQGRFWGRADLDGAGWTLEQSLTSRTGWKDWLNDPALETAYGAYLRRYTALPRTLCHDDLLPFNVLVGGARAVLIDWEAAGMLPYPAPLARLLAHGKEEPDALFFLTEEDREFAVRYYYDRLLRQRGVLWEDYRRDLDYFILAEYCEWVMLGNRYSDEVDRERFRYYDGLAKALAARLNQA